MGNGPYYNLEDWKESSRIPSSEFFGHYNRNAYLLYNAGDLEMPFKLSVRIEALNKELTLSCGIHKLFLTF
jgi:hypothetical protein